MLERLHRETLADQVVGRLTDYIRVQGFTPGHALPSEARLAAQFGVSRQVIREGLKALQGKGMVQIANGKGAVVSALDADTLHIFFGWAVQVNRDSILELMEVRKGIEVESAQLAAIRRTPDELARMEEIVAAMRAQVHDPDAYTNLDVELHLLIASASHNMMLYHLVASIREAVKDTVRAGLRHRHTDAQLERVQLLHEALLADVASGRAKNAGRAMALHFEDAVIAMVSEEMEREQVVPVSASTIAPATG